MLVAEMDQEAGTALVKYNYESAPFPWVFGFWVSLGVKAGSAALLPSAAFRAAWCCECSW